MLYVTGLELTTLTNLLFIIIPQGYLPCAKLFVMLFCSRILISSDCVSLLSTGRSTSILHNRSPFVYFIGFSLSWTPRLSRGFCLHKKERRTQTSAALQAVHHCQPKSNHSSECVRFRFFVQKKHCERYFCVLQSYIPLIKAIALTDVRAVRYKKHS